MGKRTFALDLAFDWDTEGVMQYSFAERVGTLQAPTGWKSLETKQNRISIGGRHDKNYLRIAIWGQHIQATYAKLILKLKFKKGRNAPCDQTAESPFNRKLTKALKKGIHLDKTDAFYADKSDTVWIVNPCKAGLPIAGLRKRPDSVLWFNYFPKMSRGDFELTVKLKVVIKKNFHFDPEMEVGEDDDPGEPDTGPNS